VSGVVLTLLVNAYLERRRAQDARELESLHLSSEHAKWLRDERLKAYLSLSIAGEEVLQFIRSELPVLVQPDGMNRRKDAETRWHELRTELRKTYNQVALFADEEVRAAAVALWRSARNGVNDFLRDLDSVSDIAVAKDELSEQLRTAASRLTIFNCGSYWRGVRSSLGLARKPSRRPGWYCIRRSRVLTSAVS
jgi:hypothetical protein